MTNPLHDNRPSIHKTWNDVCTKMNENM